MKISLSKLKHSFVSFLKFDLDKGISPYVYIAILILLAGVVLHPVFQFDIKLIQLGAAVLVSAVITRFLTLYKTLTPEQTAKLIIFAGLIMRIAYMLYTSIHLRNHDLGGPKGTGHLGYIMNFSRSFDLPKSYHDQFYHPPLWHLLAGIQVRIFSMFSNDINHAMENIKVLTCFFSSAVMIVVYRFLKISGLSDKAMLIALAICSFHPRFFILSSIINNDMIAMFFIFVSILYVVKWYKNPDLFNTVVLAIACGCAVMSKLSGAVIAPVIAIVFLMKLFVTNKELVLAEPKKILGRLIVVKDLLIKFAIFGIISLPIGLWYPIRNFIIFGQPLGYVRELPETEPIFKGYMSLTDRFFSFPLSEFFKNLYNLPQKDYNVWIYILKNSVFGEFSYKGASYIGWFLLTFNIILVLGSIFAMVYVLMCDKKKETFITRIVLALTWFITMGLFLKNYYDLPYGCAMDFRYIVQLILCSAGFLALAYDMLKGKKEKVFHILNKSLVVVVCGFSFFSLWFYLTIS